MTYLKQFRAEEPELFNDETGKYYKGVRISSKQCELMRDTINELANINAGLLEALEEIKKIANDHCNDFEKYNDTVYLIAKQEINKSNGDTK
jgi:hypothetical protein